MDTDAVSRTRGGRRAGTWRYRTLFVVGAWLVISPLVLHDSRVTPSDISSLISGLALAALAGWAGANRRPWEPWLIAFGFGLWLLVAPWVWQFRDGADTSQLAPIPAWLVIEPTRAAISRADGNSVLAGLLTLVLAGSTLVAARRRGRTESLPGD